MEDHFQDGADSSPPTSSKTRERREKQVKEADKYQKSMDQMTTKMSELVDLLCSDASKVLEALKSVEGLQEEAIDYALE